MNLQKFNCLPIERRVRLLAQSGRFLAKVHQGCYSKELYYMGCFFAEVWRSPANNYIVSVRGFDSNDSLEPYLEVINLGYLED